MSFRAVSKEDVFRFIREHKVVAAEWVYAGKDYSKAPVAFQLEDDKSNTLRVAMQMWKAIKHLVHVGPPGRYERMFVMADNVHPL